MHASREKATKSCHHACANTCRFACDVMAAMLEDDITKEPPLASIVSSTNMGLIASHLYTAKRYNLISIDKQINVLPVCFLG